MQISDEFIATLILLVLYSTLVTCLYLVGNGAFSHLCLLLSLKGALLGFTL